MSELDQIEKTIKIIPKGKIFLQGMGSYVSLPPFPHPVDIHLCPALCYSSKMTISTRDPLKTVQRYEKFPGSLVKEVFGKAQSVILAEQIYYIHTDEIWAFIPTEPFALSRCVFKVPSNITSLLSIRNNLYYSLEGNATLFHCKLNARNPTEQPAIFLSTLGELHPISGSGRHFYFQSLDSSGNLDILYIITLLDKQKLGLRHFRYPYRHLFDNHYIYALKMLPGNKNKLFLFESRRIRVLSFSDDDIQDNVQQVALIDDIRFPKLDSRLSHSDKMIVMPGGRYVIWVENLPIDNNQFLLVDLKKKEAIFISPFGEIDQEEDRINMRFSDIIFVSPHLIISGSNSIRVFDQSRFDPDRYFLHSCYFQERYVARPDYLFNFRAVCNVVAWPYHPERGQLWAVAYRDDKVGISWERRFSNLILVKFKPGHLLEKITDIRTAGFGAYWFPSLFIANDLLYFRWVYEESAGLLWNKRMAFDPKTGRIISLDTFVEKDKTPVGTPLGVLQDTWSSGQYFCPYPTPNRYSSEWIKQRSELADVLRCLSLDLVRLVAGYAGYYEDFPSESLPPAKVKRSPKETAGLQKLEKLLRRMEYDPLVHQALLVLKTIMLCRRVPHDERIDQVEQACKPLMEVKGIATSKFKAMFFNQLQKDRCKVSRFFEKVKGMELRYP